MTNNTDTIRVMVLKAGVEEGRIVESFPNTLAALQEAVGGYIEAVRVNESIIIWCNEEGKPQGLEHNFNLSLNGYTHDSISGDIVITGSNKEGDNVSLTWDEIDEIQKRFLNRGTFDLSKQTI